jgi:hypothetical protein
MKIILTLMVIGMIYVLGKWVYELPHDERTIAMIILGFMVVFVVSLLSEKARLG